MDKEILDYLASISVVRNHLNTLLSVGRGVIDQRTLHAVQANSVNLDRLFCQVLLTGKIPASTGPVADDYVSVSKRLIEEKAKLQGKKTPAQLALEKDEMPSEDELEEKYEDDEDAKVQALIKSAEKTAQKKRKGK